MADVAELRAAIGEGLADLDRGDVVDGETFMAELLADTNRVSVGRPGVTGTTHKRQTDLVATPLADLP